ncbi:DUF5906 domain-containing protein [Cupriavidus necator]|uniref:primase-helicase family protein n=1 Tax=Cupriavidus necator TaxID=106590 RepID=UPI003ECEB559
MGAKAKIDFERINDALDPRTVIPQWLPGGQVVGANWVALNPTRDDKTPGSFSVNLRTGQWADFAGGERDKGGDLVSLYAYLHHGGDQAKAARELAGNNGITGTGAANDGAPASKAAPKLILPVPDDATRATFKHRDYGLPSATWEYNDAQGRLLLYVCRFDPLNLRKQILPRSWCKHPNGATRWTWRGITGSNKRPLYGLDRLAANPDSDVLMVEGEKTADAGQKLAGDSFVVTSWMGGVETSDRVDLRPLQGRRVVLFPDFDSQHYPHKHERAGELMDLQDQPGMRAMLTIAKALRGIASEIVLVGYVPQDAGGDHMAGWDLADGQQDGKGQRWLLDYIAKHGGEPWAVAPDSNTRRRLQKDENARLQDEPYNPAPPFMTVDDMLADCVWIASGSQVGRISNPRWVLPFNEFCDLTAASATKIEGDDGRRRRVLHATSWKQSSDRKTVHTRTFHAGAPAICADPDGMPALNSWRPIERWQSARHVAPFLEQVEYLIADATERDAFLDWLAHIEQRPSVLPHYGWLHIAKNTGTGRNWLASVLARVWRGYVAPNVDLPALLESQFNGALAGRVLAMVDEVQEGGGENQFRHANRLKSIVNAEERSINPKFGRQFKEHNSCRWLVFSNHDNALPLNDTDRRWRVVRHNTAPRSPSTYAHLYSLLDDAEFINAVAVWLGERDISAFNPGERPPMSDAKRAAVDASKSLMHRAADELVQTWPADVVMNSDILIALSDGAEKTVTPAMRRVLEELGAVPFGRTIKVKSHPTKCWIVRNAEKWANAKAYELAEEICRARPDGFRTTPEVLAAA